MAASTKIRSLQQLLSLRESARGQGKIVVHCHGCFDIVHPGHIHHLQYARSLGDLLIVSVSTDSHVNKGVARPLIPDDLRAASLAALECVDAVYLNTTPTAVELLNELRPDVYVKGQEYERSQDPRFVAERDSVIAAGGRVVYSSGDIVYSSTALIGSLQKSDPFQDEKLRRFCAQYDISGMSIANLLHRFRGLPVLVVGDYILDRYHFCDATGVAGEAPVMALRELESREYDGGAGVIALHLAALGAAPILLTATADDEQSSLAQLRMRSSGVDVRSIPHRRQVPVKNRFLVDESKLFKVDQGSVAPIDSRLEASLAEQIIAIADSVAAVVFADFGYGLITAGLLDRILTPIRQRVQVITADVSGKQANLLRFNGVDLLCPTEREARETLGDFSSGLGAVVSKLLRSTNARQAIITLGKQGLVTFDWPMQTLEASGGRLRSEFVPALTTRTVDPMGCGDALLAASSLALAAGGSLQAAAFLGAIAGAIEVQKIGNQPITTDDITQSLHDRAFKSPVARLAS